MPTHRAHRKKPAPICTPHGYTVEPPTALYAYWTVTTPEGKEYEVRPETAECSCPAYKVCRHIRFVWGLQQAVPQLEEMMV